MASRWSGVAFVVLAGALAACPVSHQVGVPFDDDAGGEPADGGEGGGAVGDAGEDQGWDDEVAWAWDVIREGHVGDEGEDGRTGQGYDCQACVDDVECPVG